MISDDVKTDFTTYAYRKISVGIYIPVLNERLKRFYVGNINVLRLIRYGILHIAGIYVFIWNFFTQ